MFPNTDALITLPQKLCLSVPEPYMESGYNKHTQFPETIHTHHMRVWHAWHGFRQSCTHAWSDCTKSFLCEWKLIRPSRPGSPQQIGGLASATQRRDGDRPSAREQKLGWSKCSPQTPLSANLCSCQGHGDSASGCVVCQESWWGKPLKRQRRSLRRQTSWD